MGTLQVKSSILKYKGFSEERGHCGFRTVSQQTLVPIPLQTHILGIMSVGKQSGVSVFFFMIKGSVLMSHQTSSLWPEISKTCTTAILDSLNVCMSRSRPVFMICLMARFGQRCFGMVTAASHRRRSTPPSHGLLHSHTPTWLLWFLKKHCSFLMLQGLALNKRSQTLLF